MAFHAYRVPVHEFMMFPWPRSLRHQMLFTFSQSKKQNQPTFHESPHTKRDLWFSLWEQIEHSPGYHCCSSMQLHTAYELMVVVTVVRQCCNHLNAIVSN